jgi:hypothetical protein
MFAHYNHAGLLTAAIQLLYLHVTWNHFTYTKQEADPENIATVAKLARRGQLRPCPRFDSHTKTDGAMLQ